MGGHVAKMRCETCTEFYSREQKDATWETKA
jgi:hypothetical protein